MYTNPTSNMNMNSNSNVTRTKVKLVDCKGTHIATFATGNRWSDGKLAISKIVTLLRAPQVELRGEINKEGKFVVGVSYNGELYGFLNSPIKKGSLDENTVALIQKARLDPSSSIEAVVSIETRITELDALELENAKPAKAVVTKPRKTASKKASKDKEPAF